MTIEQTIIEDVQDLPPEKQQEVLNFVKQLKARVASRKPSRSLKGILARPGRDITAEDIAEIRREMWGNFPRDI